jgi:hypothetical protein
MSIFQTELSFTDFSTTKECGDDGDEGSCYWQEHIGEWRATCSAFFDAFTQRRDVK